MSLARAVDEVIASKGREDERTRLRRLMQAHWEAQLADSPELATWTGAPGHDDRWTDLSGEAVARRREELPLPLRGLGAIDRAALAPADQLDFDLFRHNAEEALAGGRFPEELLLLNQLEGVHHQLPQVLALAPAATAADLENQVARLRAVEPLLDQAVALLREGLERGVTPPAITLRDVPAQVGNLAPEDPAASPLLRAFRELPASLPAEAAGRLRRGAEAAYRDHAAPALRRLQSFLSESYLPGARTTLAARELPDGEFWYAHNVRRFTTTSLAPREIHEIGRAEVARIRGEMDAVMRSTGFEGDFSAFSRHLRSDPRFFFTRAEDLLAAYRDICKRADPELAGLFGKLPRLPYGVLPVPAYAEKSQTTAYYEPGSPEAGRPGYFFANTYDLATRPKWEMEALSLHEAVPGHHLQIALAQEMEDVPELRRHGRYTAYVEGWGLYSERLGLEMGFYKDPYAEFGRLTYEVWRAIRLVIDTGLHALGWTREEAIRYFLDNSSKSEHDVVVEVDRYIVWPGQALAYKIGELKIRELRAEAERTLGPRFSRRAFHDRVLEAGAVPLQILEDRVRGWIATP